MSSQGTGQAPNNSQTPAGVLTTLRTARLDLPDIPPTLALTVVACVLGTALAAGCGIAPDWVGAGAALGDAFGAD